MPQPNKATVLYREATNVVVGQSAEVIPLDHTSPLVSNNRWARTSTVIRVEGTTFETLNTIYVKENNDA